jgi:hypothetical protein
MAICVTTGLNHDFRLLWLCSCNLNWKCRNICSWRRLMKLECNFIFLVDSPFPTRNCCCIGEFIMIVIILWWSSVLVYLESRLCFEMKKLCVWFWKAYFGSSEEKMEKTCLWTTTFCLSSMETPLRNCEIFYTRKVRIFSNSMMQLCECQGRDVMHFVPVCYWNWTFRLAKNWSKG